MYDSGYGSSPYSKRRKTGFRTYFPRANPFGYKRSSNYGSSKTVRRKRSTLSPITKKILSLSGTYHKYFSDNVLIKTSMTHNSIYSANLTHSITQGSGSFARQGDSIQMLSFKLKGVVESATAASAYQFRVMLLFSGEEYNGEALNEQLEASEIFFPTTGQNWQPNGIVNPKAVTCVYDQTIDINSQVQGAKDLSHISVSVPLNQKFQYQSPTSNFGKDNSLYLVVIGAVTGGLAGVTNIGDCVFGGDLVFKNL